MRELPPEVVDQLHRARGLELLADGLGRQRDAVAATGALMLAIVEAGWRRVEIAAALGMNHQTVAQRVAAAGRRLEDASPALVVDAPLDRPPDPLAVLEQPVEEREWLTMGEAVEYTGRTRMTIQTWRDEGLLPNTQRPNGRVYLYLRADLQRVLRGPKAKRRGVDHKALRDVIAEAAV